MGGVPSRRCYYGRFGQLGLHRDICSGASVSDMGWLRLVGSLKLQVYFAEYCPFYRALLQKRPMILRSLLIVATPYYEHSGRGSDMMNLQVLAVLSGMQDSLLTKLQMDTSRSPVDRVTGVCYGVATISKLLKIISLFCRIKSLV